MSTASNSSPPNGVRITALTGWLHHDPDEYVATYVHNISHVERLAREAPNCERRLQILGTYRLSCGVVRWATTIRIAGRDVSTNLDFILGKITFDDPTQATPLNYVKARNEFHLQDVKDAVFNLLRFDTFKAGRKIQFADELHDVLIQHVGVGLWNYNWRKAIDDHVSEELRVEVEHAEWRAKRMRELVCSEFADAIAQAFRKADSYYLEPRP